MSKSQTLEELAKSMNTEAVSTKVIENDLYHDMLISLYRHKPLEEDQQRFYENNQKAVVELTKELEILTTSVDKSDSDLKKLKVKKTILSKPMNRSLAQIKEDLQVMGVIAEGASQAEITKAVSEENAKMNLLVEQVAEISADIDVLELENKKLHERYSTKEEKLEEEKENVAYWEDLTKHNALMNVKISKAYKDLTNKEFNPKGIERPLPKFLQGIPGQGKTATYISAAKRTAKALDLNFVRNVTENYVPDRNDFIFVVHDCSGETSSITFGGLPKGEEIEVHRQKRFALTKALNKRFLAFETAAGGALLFDDASNGSATIQNSLLSVVQEGTFSGLKLSRCLVGLTGNLGAIDNTYITEMSTALKTRILSVFVADNPKDFVARIRERYSDELGTCGIDNFVERFPEFFAKTPGTSRTPLAQGFACSRTYENMIKQFRNDMNMSGGRGVGESRFLNIVRDKCAQILGPEVGKEMLDYLNSYFSGTNDLALKFVNAQTPEDLKDARDSYRTFMENAGAHSADALSKKYEFLSALVDHTVVKLVNTKSQDPNAFENVAQKFSDAIVGLDTDMYGQSITLFKNRLTLLAPEYSYVSSSNTKTLARGIAGKLGEILAATKGFKVERSQILSSLLSGMDQYELKTSVKSATGGRKSLT